jgi:hypothetical protein
MAGVSQSHQDPPDVLYVDQEEGTWSRLNSGDIFMSCFFMPCHPRAYNSLVMFACTPCSVFLLFSNVACGVRAKISKCLMLCVLVCACVCLCVLVCACVCCVCQVGGAQQLIQDLACPRKPEEGPGQ